MEIRMRSLREADCAGKRVLLRPDLNSPLDPLTKMITGGDRIMKSAPTLRYLFEQGARVAIIAHQGDTLDYHNLTPLAEHARLLGEYAGASVRYIDDVCGPAAIEAVNALRPGEGALLGNLRYLGEELSTFEKDVKLAPSEMLGTWHVRSLAPLFDLYVNDAFSAAHRNSPSMVAFQELLPTAAGFLLYDEYAALTRVQGGGRRPSVYVLGGAKISDAFGMLRPVLEKGVADRILTCGVTGQVFLLASGVSLGSVTERWIAERDLGVFVEQAAGLLADFGDKILMPLDLACKVDGKRIEYSREELCRDVLWSDIGQLTSDIYIAEIKTAGSLFVNGPAGMYEDPLFEQGTRALWNAIADSPGYSVIGGGDTVSAAERFTDTNKFDYICTGGGAMVRFMSGKKLPLIEAMERAYDRV